MNRRPWRGGALFGDGWASFRGIVGDNAAHAHHALQLAVGAQGDIAAWVHGVGDIAAPGLLIGAGTPHRLTPGPAHLLYVDRESAMGRSLAQLCPTGVRTLDSAQSRAVMAAWPEGSGTSQRIRNMVVALDGSVPMPGAEAAHDDRVRRLLESLPGRRDWDGRLAALAREAALSPSRFRHRVRALVGMPLRPYLRWLRLRRALSAAAAGASLGDAAHDAGFSDAAHLTRTMQRHFGVAPSTVIVALRGG